MDLRITTQTVVQQTIASVRRQFSEMTRLQEEASTGKRIIRPSDAPGESQTLMAIRTHVARLDTDLANIRDGRALLDTSNSSLRDAGAILTTAREIAIEGSHSANDPVAFEALAQQVDSLISRLFDVANTQFNGQFLFAGTASNKPPFSIQASDVNNHPTSIGYVGAADQGQILLGRHTPITTLYAGNRVFQVRERSTTLYDGATGSAAGTGTDSAIGLGNLTVRHTATSFAAGSGVQPGTNSTAGDTIIGPSGAYVLTINDTSGTGASGTISLNSGPPVAFSNLDTNLKVYGPNGETIYVDTTSITAGFNGDVAVTADGTLSVDGGASEIPIDFSTNQVVTNSLTGTVTNVNSSNTRHTGTDRLNYAGSTDAFQALMALRDDLRNTRGLTNREQTSSISRDMAEVDRVREDILGVVGEQSATLANMEALEQRVQDIQLESEKQAGDIESADISEIVLRLQEQQNLLQVTFAATAKMLDLSLADFLS
jgi:flagellar hook-associated protein 3 FlgL